jgi:hypothetical protein
MLAARRSGISPTAAVAHPAGTIRSYANGECIVVMRTIAARARCAILAVARAL